MNAKTFFTIAMVLLMAVAAVRGQEAPIEPLKATLNGSSVEVVSVAS